ncbi:HSD1 protein [Coccidioides immitis RMSCC 3703]|uniref:HSD1 protein n=1 Tax=Coccidioides immitis RMSCC 3703 TaxID=454286 RepID=A0A0J8QH90_COCIT|nr:HSD1 protein [Coccidioides immitis RMSCC 3703]
MPFQNEIPATPRVISPSPTPSELSESKDGYRGPLTRSASARRQSSSPPPISEEDRGQENESGSDSSTNKRARTRSRSPITKSPGKTRRRLSGLASIDESPSKLKPLTNGFLSPNGHLSPYSTAKEPFRDLSRSPSPLGLIPLHRHYRNFIHRHEIPRKLLQCLNRLYHDRSLSPWRADILPQRRGRYGRSASELVRYSSVDFGRLYGRYTPRIRRGKSLAGTLAACAVGIVTATAFWGYLVPTVSSFANDPENSFMFTGTLNLIPDYVKGALEWVGISRGITDKAVVSGPLALGVMSLWTGIVAAGSELIDLFGWDDNLTIPVLSGVGMWGFLKVFGS